MKKVKLTVFIGILLGYAGFALPVEFKFLKAVIPEEPMGLRKVMAQRGDIFILPAGNGCVCRLDEEGRILTRYGRRGKGPGEFRFLSDFTIFGDKIIGSGGFRVNIYDLNGRLIEGFKKKHVVFKVICADKEWYYLVKEKVLDKKKRRFDAYFNLYSKEDDLVLSLPDQTMQSAFHPGKGRKLRMLWFPSPFSNRVVLAGGGHGQAAIFVTRELSFYKIEENRVKRKELKCVFTLKRVGEKDREDFFKKIIPPPSPLTKNSVIFPETKELFLGVIKWGIGWALVNENSFTILGHNGECRETATLPREMRESDPWGSGRPENLVFNYDGRLYFIKNSEEILIFQVKQ